MTTQANRHDGYSRLSIFIHWLAAIIVVALFVTHEASRGTAAYAIHVSGGAVAGVFLLWRVWHRLRRGQPPKPNQAFILNLAAQIVIWGFLAAIVVVVISGYLVPWSLGIAIDIFGLFAVPSPMAAMPGLHEFVKEVHEGSGQLFPVLFILHILGTAKHALIDKDGVAVRMIKSISGGH